MNITPPPCLPSWYYQASLPFSPFRLGLFLVRRRGATLASKCRVGRDRVESSRRAPRRSRKPSESESRSPWEIGRTIGAGTGTLKEAIAGGDRGRRTGDPGRDRGRPTGAERGAGRESRALTRARRASPMAVAEAPPHPVLTTGCEGIKWEEEVSRRPRGAWAIRTRTSQAGIARACKTGRQRGTRGGCTSDPWRTDSTTT